MYLQLFSLIFLAVAGRSQDSTTGGQDTTLLLLAGDQSSKFNLDHATTSITDRHTVFASSSIHTALTVIPTPLSTTRHNAHRASPRVCPASPSPHQSIKCPGTSATFPSIHKRAAYSSTPTITPAPSFEEGLIDLSTPTLCLSGTKTCTIVSSSTSSSTMSSSAAAIPRAQVFGFGLPQGGTRGRKVPRLIQAGNTMQIPKPSLAIPTAVANATQFLEGRQVTSTLGVTQTGTTQHSGVPSTVSKPNPCGTAQACIIGKDRNPVTPDVNDAPSSAMTGSSVTYLAVGISIFAVVFTVVAVLVVWYIRKRKSGKEKEIVEESRKLEESASVRTGSVGESS